MITLGLDPSLTGFGWAIHNSSVVGAQRVVAKGVMSTPATVNYVSRYIYLREGLKELLRVYPEVENIGAESPPFKEEYSEGLYALKVYVTEAAFLMRRDLVFFDPSTVKMLVRMDSSIRKGSIDKHDVIEAARVDTTIKRWNHNEADAFIAARSAAHLFEFIEGTLTESELTPSEAQAFLGSLKGRRGHKTRSGGLLSKKDRLFQFSQLTPAETTVPVYPISRSE